MPFVSASGAGSCRCPLLLPSPGRTFDLPAFDGTTLRHQKWKGSRVVLRGRLVDQRVWRRWSLSINPHIAFFRNSPLCWSQQLAPSVADNSRKPLRLLQKKTKNTAKVSVCHAQHCKLTLQYFIIFCLDLQRLEVGGGPFKATMISLGR